MFDRLLALFQSQAEPVPAALWQSAATRLPFIACLPEAELRALQALVANFLQRKVFSGTQGYQPDDLARVSIAMQACLPVLRLGLSAYEGWSGIVVYPGGFIVPRRVVDEDGVLHEYDEEALGEAWEGGPVVLAWYDNPEDYEGANVVIHEFAHKLDMLTGEADGLPPLHGHLNEQAWTTCLDEAYQHFCQRVDGGEDTAIDPYAAEHLAEFFAVTSEVFFVEPWLLAEEYPALYALFADFYMQDPLNYRALPRS